MTIAKKLRNEGIEIGEKKDREEGLEMTLTALQAFRAGKDIEEVIKLTGLERGPALKNTRAGL